MKKYFWRYLIFWLPAVLVSYFFNNSSVLSQVLQWFFAFFMVLGWSVNTGMMANNYPRQALALLLCHTGANLLLIVWLYSAQYGSVAGNLLTRFGGILSFQPLSIFIMALLDFNIMHELYVTVFLAALCLIGYIVGVLYRWLNPSPYRPRMRSRG